MNTLLVLVDCPDAFVSESRRLPGAETGYGVLLDTMERYEYGEVTVGVLARAQDFLREHAVSTLRTAPLQAWLSLWIRGRHMYQEEAAGPPPVLDGNARIALLDSTLGAVDVVDGIAWLRDNVGGGDHSFLVSKAPGKFVACNDQTRFDEREIWYASVRYTVGGHPLFNGLYTEFRPWLRGFMAASLLPKYLENTKTNNSP